MPLIDDGDVVRGVGYVAIYSAYVEEAIDALLEALEAVEPVKQSLRSAQASKKIKAIKRRLQKLTTADFSDLLNDLETCAVLLESRHEVIHGRLYAQTRGPDMLHPGRAGRQSRPISSNELYELANALATCRSVLRRPLVIRIRRAIRAMPTA